MHGDKDDEDGLLWTYILLLFSTIYKKIVLVALKFMELFYIYSRDIINYLELTGVTLKMKLRIPRALY